MQSRATGSAAVALGAAGSVGWARPLSLQRRACGVPAAVLCAGAETRSSLLSVREASVWPQMLPSAVTQRSVTLRWFCSPSGTKPGQTEASPGCVLHTRARALEGSAWRGLLAASNTLRSLKQ